MEFIFAERIDEIFRETIPSFLDHLLPSVEEVQPVGGAS
jgi:hypothetical protein